MFIKVVLLLLQFTSQLNNDFIDKKKHEKTDLTICQYTNKSNNDIILKKMIKWFVCFISIQPSQILTSLKKR